MSDWFPEFLHNKHVCLSFCTFWGGGQDDFYGKCQTGFLNFYILSMFAQASVYSEGNRTTFMVSVWMCSCIGSQCVCASLCVSVSSPSLSMQCNAGGLNSVWCNWILNSFPCPVWIIRAICHICARIICGPWQVYNCSVRELVMWCCEVCRCFLSCFWWFSGSVVLIVADTSGLENTWAYLTHTYWISSHTNTLTCWRVAAFSLWVLKKWMYCFKSWIVSWISKLYWTVLVLHDSKWMLYQCNIMCCIRNTYKSWTLLLRWVGYESVLNVWHLNIRIPSC